MQPPMSQGQREIGQQFVAAFPEAMELADQLHKQMRWYEGFFVRRKKFVTPEFGLSLLARQLLAATSSDNGDAAIRRMLDWVEQATAAYGRDALYLVYTMATEIILSDKVERVYPMTCAAVRQEMVEAAESTTEIANILDQMDSDIHRARAQSYRERVEAYRRVASTDGGKS
jgi:hypothetical protein